MEEDICSQKGKIVGEGKEEDIVARTTKGRDKTRFYSSVHHIHI